MAGLGADIGGSQAGLDRQPIRSMVLNIRENIDKLSKAEKMIAEGLFDGKQEDEPKDGSSLPAHVNTISIADHLSYIGNGLNELTLRLLEMAEKL